VRTDVPAERPTRNTTDKPADKPVDPWANKQKPIDQPVANAPTEQPVEPPVASPTTAQPQVVPGDQPVVPVEPKVEPKGAPKTVPTTEPKVEPRTEPIVQPKAEPKVEPPPVDPASAAKQALERGLAALPLPRGLDEAIEELERALAHDSTKAQAKTSLALAFLQKARQLEVEEPDKAWTAFGRAAEFEAGADATSGLARVQAVLARRLATAIVVQKPAATPTCAPCGLS
jgi:hypothetical protein